MQINLEERYLDRIKNIINSIILDDNLEIYVFGSRATGKARQYSDVDIALKLNEKIDTNKISKINIELENTTIPYEVDVIDLNSISDSFKKCIEKDLIKV